jgi:hypothetical protein
LTHSRCQRTGSTRTSSWEDPGHVALQPDASLWAEEMDRLHSQRQSLPVSRLVCRISGGCAIATCQLMQASRNQTQCRFLIDLVRPSLNCPDVRLVSRVPIDGGGTCSASSVPDRLCNLCHAGRPKNIHHRMPGWWWSTDHDEPSWVYFVDRAKSCARLGRRRQGARGSAGHQVSRVRPPSCQGVAGRGYSGDTSSCRRTTRRVALARSFVLLLATGARELQGRREASRASWVANGKPCFDEATAVTSSCSRPAAHGCRCRCRIRVERPEWAVLMRPRISREIFLVESSCAHPLRTARRSRQEMPFRRTLASAGVQDARN